MTEVERTLLARVAEGDASARLVLADYWQEHGDAARGAFVHAQCTGQTAVAAKLLAEHGARWRAPLIDAGFAWTRLAFADGFLPPLDLPDSDPLAHDPDALRLSPRHYQAGADNVTGTWFYIRKAGPFALKSFMEWAKDDEVDRLDREREVLARIDHPNVMRCLDRAISRDGASLVQPWAGPSLQRVLYLARRGKQAPLGEAFAVALGVQIARGLAACHAAGVVHANLNFDHVLVDDTGRATICDFSGAHVDGEVPPQRPARRGVLHHRFSLMSPEQVTARRMAEQADCFSLGLVLCAVIGGKNPVVRDNDFETLMAIRDCSFELPVMSAPLRDVVARMVARDPVARPAATEVAHLLAATSIATDGSPIADRLRGLPLDEPA